MAFTESSYLYDHNQAVTLYYLVYLHCIFVQFCVKCAVDMCKEKIKLPHLICFILKAVTGSGVYMSACGRRAASVDFAALTQRAARFTVSPLTTHTCFILLTARRPRKNVGFRGIREATERESTR